jgi:hypothetical protein
MTNLIFRDQAAMYTLSYVTPKIALVKSNSLAIVSPTWAHFIIVSQKVIT